MSTPLFDLEPDWSWNPEPWVEPVGATPAEQKAAWKAWASKWHRCVDCGTTKKLNRGTRGGMLCDDCGLVDGCEKRAQHNPTEVAPGEHVSHWGDRHTLVQHEAGLLAQAHRRASYLRGIK